MEVDDNNQLYRDTDNNIVRSFWLVNNDKADFIDMSFYEKKQEAVTCSFNLEIVKCRDLYKYNS